MVRATEMFDWREMEMGDGWKSLESDYPQYNPGYSFEPGLLEQYTKQVHLRTAFSEYS